MHDPRDTPPRFDEQSRPETSFSQPRFDETSPLPNSANASVASPPYIEYASFGARFGAAFIDGIIIGVAGFVINLLSFQLGMPDDDATRFVGELESLIIGWLYHAVMTSSARQGTFGKSLLGIKVTDLNGNRISFGRATGRYFATMLSALICLMGYFVALFTEKKQALHDLIAGTLVVTESSSSIKTFE